MPVTTAVSSKMSSKCFSCLPLPHWPVAAVSDMGNGGQVLIDHSTTMAARDWLGILGGVDHKGYNDQLILQAHRAGIKKQARSVLG